MEVTDGRSRGVWALALLAIQTRAINLPITDGTEGRLKLLRGARGTVASSLSDALEKKNDWIVELFGSHKNREKCITKKGRDYFTVYFEPHALPGKQIEVIWDGNRISDNQEGLERLASMIEEQWRPKEDKPPGTQGEAKKGGSIAKAHLSAVSAEATCTTGNALRAATARDGECRPVSRGLTDTIGLSGATPIPSVEDAIKDLTASLLAGRYVVFVGPDVMTSGDVLELLVRLSAPHYVTTTTGEHFRSAYEACHGEDRLEPVSADEHVFGPADPAESKPVLFLLGPGGAAPPVSEDRASSHDHPDSGSAPLVECQVAVLCARSPVLFVGYQPEALCSLAQRVVGLKPNQKAPPRFALLPALPEDEQRALMEHGILAVSVCPEAAVPEASAVRDFLERLWIAVECSRVVKGLDYMLDQPSTDHAAQFERVWGLYWGGGYQMAEQFLEDLIDDLCRSLCGRPATFVLLRCVYLAVKLYDKLEKWDKLEERLPKFKGAFKSIASKVPVPVYQVYWTWFCTALAIPFLHAWKIDEARRYIDEALKDEPAADAVTDAQVGYADRSTIYAIVRLAQHVYVTSELGHLDDAEKALRKAKGLFERFGNLRERDPTHHAHRFFGATAFVMMARFDCQQRDPTVAEQENLEMAACWADGDRADRPYGNLAGRYCKAYCYYWLAKKATNLAEQKRLAQEGLKAVGLTAQLVRGFGFIPRAKLACVGVRLACLLDLHGDEAQHWAQELEAVRQKCDELLRQRISTDDEVEKWLRIPLN